ncbi:MAG: hypothetical protein J6S43_03960 [Lentisphaeria bacterium]|nr:hypothetical protein [Lentisphaeria bacterium]
MCKALEYFTAVPKLHNCAQAVAAGAGDDELAENLKCCGGGNAPGGRCGALYAALLLTPEDCHAALSAEFVTVAGSENCREIKAAVPPCPCAECVRAGARLVEKYRH